MYWVLGLVLALSVPAYGEEIVFLNFPDVKSYNEIPCPQGCTDLMNLGLKMASDVVGNVLNNVPIPVDFCPHCIVGGMGGFTYDYKCFMSPEEDVFDHYLNVTFNNFYINCSCDFSNNPSELAKTVNAGKVTAGQCGDEKAQNKQTCKPFKCEGTGEGQSSIKLAANLPSPTLSTSLHVDTRKSNPGVFPLMTSITTENKEPLIHEGPTEFDNAWKCLLDNRDSVLCQLFSKFTVPFYDCLTRPEENNHNLIHAILYEYGKCPFKKPKGGEQNKK